MFYRIKPEYSLQKWFTEDKFQLIRIDYSKFIYSLGYNLEVRNLRTEKIDNIFETYLMKLDLDEVRDIKINSILEFKSENTE